MKAIYGGIVTAAFLMGLLYNVQVVAAVVNEHESMNFGKIDLDNNRHNYDLYDPVFLSPAEVEHPPLIARDPDYEIPRMTPNFRCYFKENKPKLKFEVKKAWISYEFVDQKWGNVLPVQAQVKARSVEFSSMFSQGPQRVKYTIESDHVLEEIILKEYTGITEIVQKIIFEGVEPVEKDGAIYFTNGERDLFGIPSPVMYELENPDIQCTGLHYELVIEDNQYFLKKVIDDEGIEWLLSPERRYPVVIDATTQSFEDAWETSGLTPYGQYFGNLSEYVSPSTGGLTVKQTDFYLPGRGLDVALTRVYTTPAVLSTGCTKTCVEEYYLPQGYEDGPYKYECPPVDVGNGWQLNFPWIGSEYIHFLDGSMYKKVSENHIGHHFTFENNVLTTASGIQYTFSGSFLTSICDPDGNTILFGYQDEHLTTITDTVGRVINLSYNSNGQLTQINYGSFTVTYSYHLETLTSVTDPLGRVTSYTYDQKNDWILTKVVYPTGGYTSYFYTYFAQEGQCSLPSDIEFRKYHVINQAVYTSTLVKNCVFEYQGDFDGITQNTTYMKNEQNMTKSIHDLTFDSNGLTTSHCIKNSQGTQLRRKEYTYTARKEVSQTDVYRGTSYSYSEKFLYDSWGNPIYVENGEGEKSYTCYANTNYEKVFRDFDGNIPEFSNQFFDNALQATIHTAVIGSVQIQDDKVIETYCKYDSSGHLTDVRQLFQGTANLSTFSDTFDETQSSSFSIDLSDVQLQGDAVLKLVGKPHENQVTKTETHSVYKYCNWLNEGYWQGNKYYAQYVEKGPFPGTGYEPVGPFTHYPGTAGYQSYTKWVSVYTQYVKTTYKELVLKYPSQVEYNVNGDPWKVVTSNLQSKIVYCSIPAEEFSSGSSANTLNFKESSSWITEFDWFLYVPHAVVATEDATTSFTYDTYGNMISVTDALQHTTTFGYDATHMYLTSITNALTHTTTATYDAARGFLTSITDPKGNTMSFEYDILGRVTKRINPDSTEREAVYNDAANTVTIYDELDHYTIRYFDALGRVAKNEWYLTDTVYLAETYEYNYLNKIKSKTDPGGHLYTCEYDSLGRTTKIFNPDSTFKEAHYNDAANTVSLFDENQHKREYHYDWVGRLLQVKEYTDPATYYLTEYTYDSLGHLTSATDANGNTTVYEYGSQFGTTQILYPDSTTETFLYDIMGNLVQTTDASGTTYFTYDAIYQLESVQYPDQTVTFQYDCNGNRTSMIDSAGSTTYVYDARNRLTFLSRTIDGESYNVAYGYDAASRIVSMTYPDQSVVTYQYDALNRLTNVENYAQFTYDNEMLSVATYSNGVTTTYQYDTRDRPITINAAKEVDLLAMNYQYDSVGNITQLGFGRRLPDQTWEQSTKTYQYDWLDRLISAQGSDSFTYSYDPVGNRLSLNGTTYTYNNMNELVSTSDGSSFSYDERGNVLSKDNGTDMWSYTYDSRNKLTEVGKNQENIAAYTYDGNGRRIKKTEWIEDLQDFKTAIYVYSGIDVVYEKNLTTNQKAMYVYGPTGKIAKISDGLTDYYHTDHLGSTRLITNESGDVIGEVAYKAFGGSDLKDESYLYTGKEKDASGLYYYGARYYDPDIGRFITRDPRFGVKEIPQTMNRYSYCLNNPLKYVDPDGKETCYSNPYKQLGKKKVRQHSLAPQLVQYVEINHLSGLEFYWICIAVGAVLAGFGGIKALVAIWPYLGPSLVSFGKTLAAIGPKIAAKIVEQLGKLVEWFGGMSWTQRLKTLGKIISLIKLIIDCINEAGDWLKEDAEFTLDFFTWGVIAKFVFENGDMEGYVYCLNGEYYQWKYTAGLDTYYVLIEGEWWEMPEDWRPGDPLPRVIAL